MIYAWAWGNGNSAWGTKTVTLPIIISTIFWAGQTVLTGSDNYTSTSNCQERTWARCAIASNTTNFPNPIVVSSYGAHHVFVIGL